MDRALFYIFVLSLVLIALAYYVGLTSDVPKVANAIRSLLYSVTGRNNHGNFAGYPAAAAS